MHDGDWFVRKRNIFDSRERTYRGETAYEFSPPLSSNCVSREGETKNVAPIADFHTGNSTIKQNFKKREKESGGAAVKSFVVTRLDYGESYFAKKLKLIGTSLNARKRENSLPLNSNFLSIFSLLDFAFFFLVFFAFILFLFFFSSFSFFC